jgi:WD40 repeat protein
MAIDLQCPRCSKRYRVGDQLAGKKVKCKGCGYIIPVAGDAADGAAGIAPTGSKAANMRSRPAAAGAARRSIASEPEEAESLDSSVFDAVEQTGVVDDKPIRRGLFGGLRRADGRILSSAATRPDSNDPDAPAGTVAPKSFRALTNDPSSLRDSALPLGLALLGVAGPLLLESYAAFQTPTAGATIVGDILSAVVRLGVVVPFVLIGIVIASKVMRFQLASSPYLRALAVHCAAVVAVMGTVLLATQRMGASWLDADAGFVRLVAGVLAMGATFAAIWYLFSLQVLETIVAWLISSVTTLIGLCIAGFVVSAIVIPAARSATGAAGPSVAMELTRTAPVIDLGGTLSRRRESAANMARIKQAVLAHMGRSGGMAPISFQFLTKSFIDDRYTRSPFDGQPYQLNPNPIKEGDGASADYIVAIDAADLGQSRVATALLADGSIRLLTNDDLKAMSDRIDRHRAEEQQKLSDAAANAQSGDTSSSPNAGTNAASDAGTIGQITVKQPVPPAQAKERQTPEGKPVPPPPVDAFAEQAAPTFPEDAEDAGDASAAGAASTHRSGGHRSASVPVLFNPIGSPALDGVSDVRAAAGGSPWVFVKGRKEAGGSGGNSWERFDASQDIANWKPSGSPMFLPDQLGGGQMIFSPGGEFAVRQGHAGGSTTVEAWSFNTGQLVQTIEAPNLSDLIGFIDDDRFIVSGGFPNARVAVVSAKSGKKLLELVPPNGLSFHGRECSISPEGTLLAAPATGDPSPTLLLYNTTGGVNKRIVLPGFGERSRASVAPEASAFSRDGKKVACIVRQFRSSVLFIVGVAEGKLLASFEYPDFTSSLRSSAGFGGEVPFIQWLGDSDCIILKDYAVLDTNTGRVVGCIDPDDDVRLVHSIGGGKLLAWRGRVGGMHLDVGTLDADQLKARLEAAKTAGPLQFDPPIVSGPIRFAAASITAPKAAGSSTLGAAPDPAAPPGAAKPIQTPIAIDATYSRIREVRFSRPPAAPAAVIALAPPGSSKRQWDPLRDPDFVLQRLDLVTGAAGGAAIHLPVFSKLLAISPDATLALVASDIGDPSARQSLARLDLISLTTGKATATFAPYADLNASAAAPKPPEGHSADKPKVTVGAYSVIWAAITENNDGLVTLSGSHVLVRWSVSGHKALWARTNVVAEPVFSPHGKYLAVFENNNALLLIDPNTGEVIGSLAADPLVGNELKSAKFSNDGAAFCALTTNGLFRWDVKSGAAGNPLTTDKIDQIEDLGDGQGHLLADDRLFDTAKNAFVFTYTPVGGRHLYDAPAPGRHWYLARNVDDGVPHLCSAVIPTAEQLQLAARLATDPPLIRPGVQVALQVNCGGATDKVQQSLAARLKSRRLDQGPGIATLQVVATESPTGEQASFVHGLNPFAQDPNAEKVQLQQYECYFDLMDSRGHVLYGSPKTQIIRNVGVAGVMLKPGQSVSDKLEEILQQNVLTWANSIYLPTYLSASGQIAQRPEALLGVNKP